MQLTAAVSGADNRVRSLTMPLVPPGVAASAPPAVRSENTDPGCAG